MSLDAPKPTQDSAVLLADRLQSLERQLSRLSDLLMDQEQTKVKRRRLLTLRVLLLSFVLFGLLFSWFGYEYRGSRRQASAVDDLVSHGAFIHYEPRQSAMVSLMPGDALNPPKYLTRWLGHDFFRAVTNLSSRAAQLPHKQKRQIIKSVSALRQLERLRLSHAQLRTGDLNDLGALSQLRSLDLTRSGLDGGAFSWLRNTQLRWFAAGHTRVGDRLLYDLAACSKLRHLDLERTSISNQGLQHLRALQQLRYLNLKRCPVTRNAVLELSKAIPNCYIEWEPLRFRSGGRVDVAAARNGYSTFGRQTPDDPRMPSSSMPPFDSSPVAIPEIWNWNTQTNYSGVRQGFMLDAF